MSALQSNIISIQPAKLSDASSIARIGAYAFRLTHGEPLPADTLDKYLNRVYAESTVLSDLQDLTKDIFVAKDSSGDVLGFAYLTRGSNVKCLAGVDSKVELERLYVAPRAHGKGIGRLLARTIEDIAREQGHKNIWLGAWENNRKALSIYENWGYRCYGQHDFYIESVVQKDNVLVKLL